MMGLGHAKPIWKNFARIGLIFIKAGLRKITGAAYAVSVLAMSFGKAEQLVRIAQHDALPATLDQALLFPRAENAADSVQRGAGHLGDVLPTDRKIDLHALFDFAAGLLGQPQQGMCDTLLDLFAGHLDDAGLG